MKAAWSLALILVFAGGAQAAVVGEEVTYQAGGTTMKGYLAYDDAVKGKRPGVLVVHEWWGHNDYARMRARMLAEMGYTALAVDMFGDGKTADHPDDAGKFATAVNSDMAARRARFIAARKLLAGHKTVNGQRIAAIGYCFGGGVVLAMAREGVKLDGVASFHGSLATNTPARTGQVKAKVLVLTGAADPMAPSETVEKFKQEMSAAKVDHKVVVYPGARHSFTNPDATAFGEKFGMPLAYDAAADKESWAELDKFLKKVFGRK
ncbi:MAG TPA: dienelactone hydrolase family protein [Acidiferrobacterales bacterium]